MSRRHRSRAAVLLPDDTVRLRRTVEALAGEPRFWGCLVARRCRAEGLSPEALARTLGLTPGQLWEVCWCLQPRAERPVEDLERVADACGVPVAVLRQLQQQG